MTTADTQLEFELDPDFLVDRPVPGMLILRRIAAAIRRYIEAWRRKQSLRHLSDHMLRDIGVDPESVRDDFPSIAPNSYWLPDRRSLRQ